MERDLAIMPSWMSRMASADMNSVITDDSCQLSKLCLNLTKPRKKPDSARLFDVSRLSEDSTLQQ